MKLYKILRVKCCAVALHSFTLDSCDRSIIRAAYKRSIFSFKLVVQLKRSHKSVYLRPLSCDGGELNSNVLIGLCICVCCQLVAGPWNCNLGVWPGWHTKVYIRLQLLSEVAIHDVKYAEIIKTSYDEAEPCRLNLKHLMYVSSLRDSALKEY
jgi:hypothetical protein